jgi:hypothetical protein
MAGDELEGNLSNCKGDMTICEIESGDTLSEVKKEGQSHSPSIGVIIGFGGQTKSIAY